MSRNHASAGSERGLARFLHRVRRLKGLPRTGWLDRGIPPAEVESVADHSFRTALLAWLAAAQQPALDRDRVLKLALVHDLAEALTGDLPPYETGELPAATESAARRAFLDRRHRRSPEQAAAKQAAEAAAIADLVSDLPPALAAELRGLWDEAAAAATPEARFAKEADRLETYLQSREYLAADRTRPMASFAAEVDEAIHEPALVALRDAIRSGADEEAS